MSFPPRRDSARSASVPAIGRGLLWRHWLAQAPLLAKSVVIVLTWFVVTACQAKDEAADGKDPMSLRELLCIYTPSSCHGKMLLELYGAPPGAMYERKFRDQVLRIPTGYISDTELLVDSRYPMENSSLYLVALLPDLKPRDRSNLREFFIPHDRNLIAIQVGPRFPGAVPWEEARQRMIRSAGEVLSIIRRPDKYGLEVYGEDYDRYPKRRPCETPDTDRSTCRSPHAQDVLWPIHQEGERSLMLCDPDILPDARAKVDTMTTAEQEAWYASKAWFGVRKAMCRHEMYYQPLNSIVVLRYQRHFISQWRRTEQLVRDLLDRAQLPATANVPSPAARDQFK